MSGPAKMVGGLEAAIGLDRPFAMDAQIACAPGELMGLIGPSGSGKTTLLRALAGLVRPPRGRISVGARVWQDAEARTFLPPQARRVGLVFQDFALFPHLTARETVALAIDPEAYAGRSAQLQHAERWLTRVNLQGLGDRKPDALSGGQRQRVAVARALARDPDVLLLDEPFSAVDQMTRERLKRELASLRASLDIPIILVTHDLDEASALCDRLTLLHRGHVLQSGAADDMLSRPASTTAARLLGHTNIFPATVAQPSTPDQAGRIAWRDTTLEVADTGPFNAGERVAWVLPADQIVMHRRERPSLGERENPITGAVSEMARLGAETAVTLRLDDETGALNFRIATHAARRNGVEPGVDVTVSLLADGIHLVPERASEADAI